MTRAFCHWTALARQCDFSPIKRSHPSIQHLARRTRVILRLTSVVDKARVVFAAALSAHTMTILYRPENNPTVAMAMLGTGAGG